MVWVRTAGGSVTAASRDTPTEPDWVEATPAPQPADTDAGTWVDGVAIVAGEPVQTWTFRAWTDAELAQISPERLAELQAVGRGQQLREAVREALAANDAYLALNPPTAAQTVAQVQALTRQVSALARIALDALK